MKRFIWGILLAFCMMLTMFSVISYAGNPATEEVNTQGELFSAVNGSSSTIKLTNDIDIDSTLEINRAVTLDLNGYILKLKSDIYSGSVIKVNSDGNLTITDSRPASEHYYDKRFSPWIPKTEYTNNESIYTVFGGIIAGGTGYSDGTSTYGGGVYISDEAELNMYGGNIVSCKANTAGGVYISEKGDFNFTGGCILGCSANHIGGVYADGTFTMSGSALISNCNTFVDYGYSALMVKKTFYANGGSIYGNVYVDDNDKENDEDKGKITQSKNSKSFTIFYNTIYNDGVITGIPVKFTYYDDYNVYATEYVAENCKVTKPTPPIFNDGIHIHIDSWYYNPDNKEYIEWDFDKDTVKKKLILSGALESTVSNQTELEKALAKQVSIITLGADIDFDGSFTILNDCILDLNGCVLNQNSKDPASSFIYIKSNADFILIDSRPKTEHKFIAARNKQWELTDNDSSNKNTKTVYGGIITSESNNNSSRSGGAIFVDDGTLTMNGGNIVGCTADCGGGVYTYIWGSFTMNGGSIIGCDAFGGGSAVCVRYNTFTMNGGTIESCTGSSVYTFSEGTFKMKGGSIIRNNKLDDENCVLNDGTFTISDNAKLSAANCAIYNTSNINANGGTVKGSVINASKYSIIRNTNKTPTVFESDVSNYGTISGGIFEKEVKNLLSRYDISEISEIKGGEFYDTVTNVGINDNKCIISGGIFYGDNQRIINIGGEIVGSTIKFITDDQTQYAIEVVSTSTEEPKPPTKDGLTFTGWYEDGSKTAYTFGGSLSQDLILTAQWKASSSGAASDSNASKPRYSISADETENGTVSITPLFASKGDTVTITVTPDSGYALEKLKVTGIKDEELIQSENNKNEYTFKMPNKNVSIQASFIKDESATNIFVDVFPNDYYYDAAIWAASNGIVLGTSPTTFSPDDSCTRGQLVTFLWRAVGSPPSSASMSFTDVKDDSYYSEAVKWAAELGIIEGFENSLFCPDNTLTREQAATLLYRFSESQGIDITQGGMSAKEYDDYESISEYAVNAMQWAVNAGIMQGADGKLMPSDGCTRAQITTMLYRLLG